MGRVLSAIKGAMRRSALMPHSDQGDAESAPLVGEDAWPGRDVVADARNELGQS
jgi:hypothetical protein